MGSLFIKYQTQSTYIPGSVRVLAPSQPRAFYGWHLRLHSSSVFETTDLTSVIA